MAVVLWSLCSVYLFCVVNGDTNQPSDKCSTFLGCKTARLVPNEESEGFVLSNGHVHLNSHVFHDGIIS